MAVARYLVQGSDVWLNTPRRPREASGTSRMKAAANGALNLSTLDGWWDEAYQPEVGWAIGRGEVYEDHEEQDQVEAEALYDLLERDVVPTFYDRGADRLPRRWIARMQASIGGLCQFFNAHRMIRDYSERFYLPTAARYRRLADDGMAGIEVFAAWKARVQEGWSEVRVEAVEAEPSGELRVGDEIRARAPVRLGDLTPEDVMVELYLGRVDADREIIEPETTRMRPFESSDKGGYVFEASAAPCRKSGRHGCTVRVLPHHPDMVDPFLPELIVWAGSDVKAT